MDNIKGMANFYVGLENVWEKINWLLKMNYIYDNDDDDDDDNPINSYYGKVIVNIEPVTGTINLSFWNDTDKLILTDISWKSSKWR